MIKFKTYTEFINEGVTNPVFKNDKSIGRLKYKLERANTMDEKRELIYDFYEEHLPFFKKVKKKLTKTIKKTLKKKEDKTKLLVGLKPKESLFDKSIKRHKPIDQINDIVRCAVIFKDKYLIDEWVRDFLRKNSNVVDYEKKDKKSSGKYGYFGSHHIDLNIDGLIVEIQVMSRKLWDYKEEGHKIYQNSRSSGGPSEFYQNVSKNIFNAANEDELFDDMGIYEEIDV